MFRNLRTMTVVGVRTIKNFGHKREPVPFVTTLWHGTLTFSFIGLALNWEKFKKFIFGESTDQILQEALTDEDKIS